MGVHKWSVNTPMVTFLFVFPPYQGDLYIQAYTLIYSRVQKSWNEVFFKILKKPSIAYRKKLPQMKAFIICIDKKTKN